MQNPLHAYVLIYICMCLKDKNQKTFRHKSYQKKRKNINLPTIFQALLPEV